MLKYCNLFAYFWTSIAGYLIALKIKTLMNWPITYKMHSDFKDNFYAKAIFPGT